jgi:hypothetical protein
MTTAAAREVDDYLRRLDEAVRRRQELERIAALHARLVPSIRAMRAEELAVGNQQAIGAAGALEWVLREMGEWTDGTNQQETT